MINVVCLRWGEKFSRDYVNILYDMVKRNFLGEFRFICVTDDPNYDEGIETVQIPQGLEGWWGKLWLFSDEFQKNLDGQVFFFDLDTVITGELDEIFKYRGEFMILRDFYRHHGYGSGLMSWRAKDNTHIWDRWICEGQPRLDGGDQVWIEKCISGADLWQEIFPGEILSYKVHCSEWPPNESKIVCFHGIPMPHQCKGGWVELMWQKGGMFQQRMGNSPNTTTETFLNQARENCKLPLPWMNAQEAHNGTMVIVGGAPSLKENFQNIKSRQQRGQKIFALNGAIDALMERGIKPDYGVIMDARQENVCFVEKKHPIKYLINAFCHPDMFKALEGMDVEVWHSFIEDEQAHLEILNQYPDRPWGIIPSGNTVGITTIVMGFVLGYRKIHLYGMDSSYSDGEHHAYEQKLNQGEDVFEIWANNKKYLVSRWMHKQVLDFQRFYKELLKSGVYITAHGNGLLPDVCRYINGEIQGALNAALQNR